MKKLLVLEGLDGSGKSTQTELLRQALLAHAVPVRQIKLPDYDSSSSALVKMYLNGDFGTRPDSVNAYAAASFFAVDRYASFHTSWKEDYDRGTLILADRYTTSNASYQMTKLNESEWRPFLDWLTDYEYEKLGLPEPSLVVFLDMPVEVSQILLSRRYGGNEAKKDVHESNVQYLQHCRKAALFAAEQQHWEIISCSENGTPRTVEAIAADVYALVERKLLKDNAT